jgi:predicted RNA-binding protein with PUA-like domain
VAVFLFKTEPGEYSFDALMEEGTSRWNGISNPAANKHLRSMKKGDEILVFHTGDEKSIDGLAKAVSDPYADPDRVAFTAAGDIKFVAIDVKGVARARKPLPLADIKADAKFAEFPLVTQGRLSVMPVPANLDKVLRQRAGL